MMGVASQGQVFVNYNQKISEISERLKRDEDAFSFFQSLLIFELSEDHPQVDSLSYDYYLWKFNCGNPMCRFMIFDSIMQVVPQCSKELIIAHKEHDTETELHVKEELVELLKKQNEKTLQKIAKQYFWQICSRLSFYNTAEQLLEDDGTMYLETGEIDMQYYVDGWEGWEEPSEFVSRFKRVKEKLLQDANMRTQLYNFLREGRKTQRKDVSTSREALLRYYERQQGSWLYSFYEFEALYQACRQYYARKNEKMLRWKQKEGYCLPKTKGEWYDQVVTHYRYYKHADTQQRRELQENFERYLAQ